MAEYGRVGGINMNDNERKVLELINIKNFLSTAEMCNLLGISESTARRILAKLEERKLIKRFHGGGQSIGHGIERTDIEKRLDVNAETKEAIAKAAAGIVKAGSVIIMMGGTTVHKMCKYLQRLDITVITNSMLVFEELKKYEHINIILLGGKYNRSEMEVSGVITNSNLKLLRADYLFMGTKAFDSKLRFMTDEIESVELYRLCMEAAKTVCVLSDSTKLNQSGMAVTADSNDIDMLVTDSGIDGALSDECLIRGIDLITVDTAGEIRSIEKL